MSPTHRVRAQYLGHSAFLLTSPGGVRVLIDPYRDMHPNWDWRWFFAPFPRLEADIVLVTHEHFDHNAVERVDGDPMVIREAGEVRIDDVRIVGIRDKHASPDEMPNTIFVYEMSAVRFCHLGDNRADVPEDVVRDVGSVDVLLVPVDDSSHLLRFWEVNQLVATFGPKIVVPVHYLAPGITDPASTLLACDGWLRTQPLVRRIGKDRVELDREALPAEREVWVFEAHPGRTTG
jgi:L-ascorbate metabolism protein UlaG (beta-lactamase superfamily)